MKLTKGQLFTWDLAISVSVFLVALGVLYYLWDSTVYDMEHTRTSDEIERLSVEISEQLIRTPGVPTSWQTAPDDVSVIGLANERPRILNSTKVEAFVWLMKGGNYTKNRYKLGTRGYNFYFNVTHLNGSQYYIGGTPCYTGKTPEDMGLNASDIVTTARTSIINGTIVKLKLTVWQREY